MNPQDVRKLIPEIAPEDGTDGYLVQKHWTRWVPFVLAAPAITLGCVGAVAWASVLLYRDSLGWAIVPVAFGAAWLLWHVDVLWYSHLRNTVMLLTPRNLYVQRVEKLFYTPSTIISATKIVAIDTKTSRWNWIWIDARTVTITTEGDAPNAVYPYAAEGEGIERGLQEIRQKIQPT